MCDGERTSYELATVAEKLLRTNMNVIIERARSEALEEAVAFRQFVALARRFVARYPADIVDGSSGDPGSRFVVVLRNAIEALPEATAEPLGIFDLLEFVKRGDDNPDWRAACDCIAGMLRQATSEGVGVAVRALAKEGGGDE